MRALESKAPTFLTLPDHTPAIILRSVARQRDPATTSNPDVLTLSRVRTTGNSGRITSGTPVVIDPVNESSVILRPTPNSTLDDRGVQDPRVMQDPVRTLATAAGLISAPVAGRTCLC